MLWRGVALAAWILGAAMPGGAGEPPARGLDAAEIEVLALAPASGRAVLRLARATAAVYREGDALPGGGVTLRRVLADRVEIEQTLAGIEPTKKRWLWIYETDAGGTRVEVIDRHPLPYPVLTAPRRPEREGGGAAARQVGAGETPDGRRSQVAEP